MEDKETLKQLLLKIIQLADQVIQSAKKVTSFRLECDEIKSKTEKLATLIRSQATEASSVRYDRPVRVIVAKTETVLDNSLSLVLKCRQRKASIQASAFVNTSLQLENSLGNITWILSLFFSSGDGYSRVVGLPPFAEEDMFTCITWIAVERCYRWSLEERRQGAMSLLELSREADRYKRLIVEEGGLRPLLKLLNEGGTVDQVTAVKVIGSLGCESELVQHLVGSGVVPLFVKILREGAMEVQAEVAWAVSEFVAVDPKCQDKFAQHNVIRPLVSHLSFETVEHFKNVVYINKATSVLGVVMAAYWSNTRKVVEDDDEKQDEYLSHQESSTIPLHVKTRMKAMTTKALANLAKGNASICRSITETSALMCFAVLLEKGSPEVQFNSALALVEITAVAERDTDLRRSAFKHISPSCKAVINQLVKIIERADPEALIPCIKAMGNLARTFRVTETRIIVPLVRLLDERRKPSREASITLIKFVCKENHLRIDNSKAIVNAGGIQRLVSLARSREKSVRVPALGLLCYIAAQVPGIEELSRPNAIPFLLHPNAIPALQFASFEADLKHDDVVYALVKEVMGSWEFNFPFRDQS